MKKAIFLDRDGTIIQEVNLLTDIKQLRLLPHAGEALKLFKKLGFLLIVVTNQPVVARGLINEKKLQAIHHVLARRLAKLGILFDAIYYCPHHPEATLRSYRKKCQCRKPFAGNFRKAIKKFRINTRKSFMIGDSTRDILAGKHAGLKTILVKTGFGGLDKKFDAKPDRVARNIFHAAKMIENWYNKKN